MRQSNLFLTAGALALAAALANPVFPQGQPPAGGQGGAPGGGAPGGGAPGGGGPGGGGRGGRGGRGGQGAPVANPVGEHAAQLAAEIHLLHIFPQARMSRELLDQIHELVARSYQQLQQGDAAAAGQLAQAKPLLIEAKKQVLGGKSLDVPTAQEANFAQAQLQVTNQREAFLRQLTGEVRKLLEAIPPEQRVGIMAAGTAFVRERRAQQMAGFGNGGGRSAGELDRLRSANQQDYPNQRTQFAMRNANVQGWWMMGQTGGGRPGGGPGGGGPGGGGPGGGGPGGGGRFRGGPGGGGPGGGPGGRFGGGGGNVQPPNKNDPPVRHQVSPLLRLADQVRNMPQATYQMQRDQLANQLDQIRQQSRINAPVQGDEALDALARALSSEAGLAAMDSMLGKVRPTDTTATGG
jgi:hypothetical protein